MFSYFVPISLMVLAGFALGLLVGWLTWVSSREPADQEPADQEPADQEPADQEPADQKTPNDAPEPAATVPDLEPDWTATPNPLSDWSAKDLPFWRMREVSHLGHSDEEVSSTEY